MGKSRMSPIKRLTAGLLIDARHSRRRLNGLPADVRPMTVEDAHAIQDAVHEASSERIGALKVNAPNENEVYRGIIPARRVVTSPAKISARDAGLMGIEAEIAFLFLNGVRPQEEAYDYSALANSALALPAFDIVDTRFEAFMSRSPHERIADSLNAGFLVHGAARRDWRDIAHASIHVRLMVDGAEVFAGPGKHVAGDPFLPVVRYLDTVREKGCPPGTLITTGSFTGLTIAKAKQVIRAEFAGFSPIEVEFRP
jgi:2-keto-4-pentenoate hydratase